jgi:magnesium transporter
MLRSMHYVPGQAVRLNPDPSEYKALLEQPGLLWVDFESSRPEDDEPILTGTFGFHPLAVDDALQESHTPKIDDWEDFLYIVLHALVYNSEHRIIETRELDIFAGQNYLVTHHDDPIPALQTVWETVQRDERFLKNGADRLLYRLMDEVVMGYMPIVDELDDAVDKAEAEIFGRPTSHTLAYIFTLKRAVLQMRRIIGPQREVLNKLARDEYQIIGPQERIYFRDVYDHLVRLYDLIESLRDLVGGTLDTYLSVINNRMNDVMKTLTVITVLFMPLSFIASFFGMNFFAPEPGVPGWVELPVFTVTMGVMMLIPVVMYLWFRRRGWM